MDKSGIDEADAIEAATKDPNIGTITHATKTPDNDGEESKEVMDDATRALNPTEKENKNNCGLCDKSLSTEDYLKEHIETHMQGPGSDCSVCDGTFNRREVTNEHVKTHSGDQPSECRFCGKLFFKSELIRSGVNKKEKLTEKLGLEIDAETAKKIAEDEYTDDKNEAKEKKSSCSFCGRGFSRKYDMEKHTRNHTGEKPYQCGICAKKFVQVGSLAVHMRGHTGERPHVCKLCNKDFAQLHHLKKHMLCVHKTDKPYYYQKWKEEKPNLKVEDKATETIDNNEDYSPAAEELKDKFYTFDTHISSFRSFPSLKCVSIYPDCLVTDKKITYDELTALDYERTGYMMLTMVMKETFEMVTTQDQSGDLSGLAVDWLEAYKTEVHAECSEDDADDNDDRPAEPGTQLLRGPPLYALPAYRESGQGTRFASNWIHLKESVLNHRNMQARVPKDCLDDPAQAVMETQNELEAQYIKKNGYMMIINMSHTKDNKAQFVRRALYPEMQNKESAQYIEQDVLTMTQDLDVNKEFEEGPTNAKNTALCVPEDFDVNAEQMQEECEP